ncbi:hypothetical protein H4Q26_000488 [Puccinia striiformis f. sp. tritici PST-130]|nr:hypothetical protein H4Q26_000488 [Puccinia striiformis f. sp. tritici PST-130]
MYSVWTWRETYLLPSSNLISIKAQGQRERTARHWTPSQNYAREVYEKNSLAFLIRVKKKMNWSPRKTAFKTKEQTRTRAQPI